MPINSNRGYLGPINTDRGRLGGIEQAANAYIEASQEAMERKRQEDKEQKERSRQDDLLQYERDRQSQQDEVGLLKEGLIRTPEGGLSYSPEKQAQMDRESKYKEAQTKALNKRASRNYGGVEDTVLEDGTVLEPLGVKRKIVPAAQAQEFGGANSSIKQLQDYDALLNKNSDVTGKGFEKGALRAKEKVKSFFSGGNDVANRVEALTAAQQKVAQVIGKYLEGGKLTDADIMRYREMLPTVSDNPQVAAAKSAQLQKLIAEKQAQEKSSMSQAGYQSGRMQQAEPNVQGLGLLDSKPQGLVNDIKEIGGKKYKRVNGGWEEI